MNINRKSFKPDDLSLVALASEFQDDRQPALRIGDIVRLNSGSAAVMVVDFEGDSVVVAYREKQGQVEEVTLPRPCVHRISVV